MSELLIALAILGVIATFTIPKVLQSQKNSSYKAAYLETMKMMAGSFEAYKLKNSVTPNTKMVDLTPYMNYVKVVSSGLIDHTAGNTTLNCGVDLCLLLHNGGVIQMNTTHNFGFGTTTNFINFNFDPDGKVTAGGGGTGPGKGMSVDLFYNGRITSGVERPATNQTCFNGTSSCMSWGGDAYPDWFTSW